MSLTQSLFSSFSKKWRPVLRGIPEEIPRNRFTVDKTWPSNNRLESIWNCPGTYLTNSFKCTFTSNRNFQLKIGLIFSDISEEFHDLLQNRIGEVRILSEVRSYFHCGIDIKVRLTRRPGPFAWQFKFFSWQKGHFFRRMMFSLFSSLFKRKLNCMIALVNSMYQK